MPHTLKRSLVGNPSSANSSYALLCESKSIPVRAPTPCTTILKGRDAVTRGSFCRREPAAALRGLAKRDLPASSSESLSSAKAAKGKKTSPRTSINAGTFLPFNVCGNPLIVFTFSVTSSPVTPLPRVNALTSSPFSYFKLIARPSTLSSHKYVGAFASFSTRSNQPVSSSASKTLSKLIIFSM